MVPDEKPTGKFAVTVVPLPVKVIPLVPVHWYASAPPTAGIL